MIDIKYIFDWSHFSNENIFDLSYISNEDILLKLLSIPEHFGLAWPITSSVGCIDVCTFIMQLFL